MDDQRDTTDRFLPRFDAAGLVTAIVADTDSHTLLMVAHMNAPRRSSGPERPGRRISGRGHAPRCGARAKRRAMA